MRSDLQGRCILDYPKIKSFQLHIVNQKPENTNNVYIDSLYLGNSDGNQIPLNIRVVGLTEGQTLPLSVFNKKRLIAKTAVKGTTQNATEITISLQTNEMIQGRVYIEDPVLEYDNHFFFSIDERNPPKVLAISEAESNFLERLFGGEDFEYSMAY